MSFRVSTDVAAAVGLAVGPGGLNSALPALAFGFPRAASGNCGLLGGLLSSRLFSLSSFVDMGILSLGLANAEVGRGFSPAEPVDQPPLDLSGSNAGADSWSCLIVGVRLRIAAALDTGRPEKLRGGDRCGAGASSFGG